MLEAAVNGAGYILTGKVEKSIILDHEQQPLKFKGTCMSARLSLPVFLRHIFSVL